MVIDGHVQLRNGVNVPLLGLGTTHSGGYNHNTVLYALDTCGYRLLDTAKRYGTEPFVGQAIKEAKVEREEVFLTTKLWPGDYGLRPALSACRGSLRRLQTEYLDLYLLHCPPAVADGKQCLEETWRALELLLDADRCRAIGVSNFGREHLEHLLEFASVVPHVNQVEFHPYQNPKELRAFCDENGVQFQGYCPLAKGIILQDPPVIHIADKLKMTPAQVLLRWSVQNKVITIPKSTKKERVWENMQVLNDEFHIPERYMSVLDNLHSDDPAKRIINPEKLCQSVNRNLPDGYKLHNAVNVFPKSFYLSKSRPAA